MAQGEVAASREEDREKIIGAYRSVWPAGAGNDVRTNPAPLPVTLDADNLHCIRSRQRQGTGEEEVRYVVAPKDNGVRAFLQFGTLDDDAHGGGKKRRRYAVFIDRALEIYPVAAPVVAPSWMFDGLGAGSPAAITLLDGEFLHDEGVYLVFDIVALGGERACQRWTYTERLRLLREDVVPRISVGGGNGNGGGRSFTVQTKIVRPATELGDLLSELAKGKRGGSRSFDGLIFTPIYEPVRVGRHCAMYKWKPFHTIDVGVAAAAEAAGATGWGPSPSSSSSPPLLFEACGGGGGLLVPVPRLGQETIEFVPLDDGVGAAPSGARTVIVECLLFLDLEPDPEKHRQHPRLRAVVLKALFVRPDKDVPNSTQTYRRTLLSALNGVTAEDIVKTCSSKCRQRSHRHPPPPIR